MKHTTKGKPVTCVEWTTDDLDHKKLLQVKRTKVSAKFKRLITNSKTTFAKKWKVIKEPK